MSKKKLKAGQQEVVDIIMNSKEMINYIIYLNKTILSEGSMCKT